MYNLYSVHCIQLLVTMVTVEACRGKLFMSGTNGQMYDDNFQDPIEEKSDKSIFESFQDKDNLS